MGRVRLDENFAFEVVGHLLGVQVEPYDCRVTAMAAAVSNASAVPVAASGQPCPPRAAPTGNATATSPRPSWRGAASAITPKKPTNAVPLVHARSQCPCAPMGRRRARKAVLVALISRYGKRRTAVSTKASTDRTDGPGRVGSQLPAPHPAADKCNGGEKCDRFHQVWLRAVECQAGAAPSPWAARAGPQRVAAVVAPGFPWVSEKDAVVEDQPPQGGGDGERVHGGDSWPAPVGVVHCSSRLVSNCVVRAEVSSVGSLSMSARALVRARWRMRMPSLSRRPWRACMART